jgi:CheY-like chemotaxis protein
MARLLLVDDDRDQLKLWRLFFEASGHEIETAETLGQAIEQLLAFAPDVLIMDLRLPELKHGLELIRKAGDRPSTSVVVLSGWPQDLESLPERKLVDRILAKPVKPPVLSRTVAELVPRSASG